MEEGSLPPQEPTEELEGEEEKPTPTRVDPPTEQVNIAVKPRISDETTILVTKMQKKMQQAEVKEVQARTKREAAKKRKEVSKMEEQEKHKQRNRNIRDMLEIWGGGRKAKGTGKPASTNDLVRKEESGDAGRKAKELETLENLEGKEAEEDQREAAASKLGVGERKANQASKTPLLTNLVRKRESRAAGRKAKEVETLENMDDKEAEEDQQEAAARKPGDGGRKANQAGKPPPIITCQTGRKAKALVRNLENLKVGVGENKEHKAGNSSPQIIKTLVRKNVSWNIGRKAKDWMETLENKHDKGTEEDQPPGTARNTHTHARKEAQGTEAPGTGIGTNDNFDRKPQTAVRNRKEGTDLELELDEVDGEEVEEARKEAARNRRVGVTRVVEPRLKVTDLINNFNTLEKEGVEERNKVDQVPRNKQQVMVESRNKELLNKVTNGVKRKQVEEETPGTETLNQKRMRKLKSEKSERENSIRKYFSTNTSSFTTKEHPVRVQGRGGEPEHLNGGGEKFPVRRRPRNTGLSN